MNDEHSTRPQYLGLSTAEMKRLGYAAVDMLVEHFNTVEHKPVVDDQAWRPTSGLLAEPFSEQGKPADDVLARVREEVFAHCIHINHPRFFAYVPGSSNFVSVLADQLASGFNVFSGTNQGNLGPITVERNTIKWLCEQFGLPAGGRRSLCQRRFGGEPHGIDRGATGAVAGSDRQRGGLLHDGNAYLH